MNGCSLCHGGPLRTLYAAKGLPLFQNKVYASAEEAKAAPTGDVTLVQCERCGFVYNAAFDPIRMDYDDAYQNEQAHSPHFRAHLERVADLVIAAAPSRNVLEIGCGKGTFLTLLKERGAEMRGFDPAYEGDDPDVVRDYFRRDAGIRPADLIVLRHTLEHVAKPLEFLRGIAEANGGRGKIFIEVPDFAWIANHGAFWDLFYEHCNYFDRGTLSALFGGAEWHELFGGQYQAIVADLAALTDTMRHASDKHYAPMKAVRERYAHVLNRDADIYIWGGASKGVIFALHADPQGERIKGLIDINPMKQGRFVPVTGLPLYPPEHLDAPRSRPLVIVVANPNYLAEIKHRTLHLHADYVTL